MDAANLGVIVRYCIGSSGYRAANAGKFGEAVRVCVAEELGDYLELMNLSGLLADRLGDDQLLPADMRSWIQASMAIEEILTRTLLEELRQLGTEFERLGLEPILLKGPALWGEVYPIYHQRRVNDIDLIIENPADVLEICKVLAANGYGGAGAIRDSDIADRTHYELPAFPKTVVLQCAPEVDALLDPLIARAAVNRTVRKVGRSRYEARIDVEVHKAIYLLTGTLHPELRRTDFARWTIMAPYRVMTQAATLPYLCTKLSLDVHFGTPKCLKLLADIIRILARAAQGEVQESIRTAERWKVMRPYLDALGWVLPLAPELELAGVVPGPADAVSKIVDSAIGAMTSSSAVG